MNKMIFKTIEWSLYNKYLSSSFNIENFSIEGISDFISDDENSKGWIDCENWENMDDLVLLRLLSRINNFTGDLCIVTEASYNSDVGPFWVNSFNLKEFVSCHLDTFKECFFNGDVVIINFIEKKIWIFHHEGIYKFYV